MSTATITQMPVRSTRQRGNHPAGRALAAVNPRTTQPATQATQQSASLRLTRRGRLVVFVSAMVLLGAALLLFGSSVVATDTAGTPAATSSVTVQAGQTVWDIAGDANPDGDIRATVDDIVELNSLPSAGGIQIGQELAVPRY